jgi:adenylosuccinate synthase
MIEHGKLNVLIDGQFGSTGKGLMANYVGWMEHVDIAISNGSPNAGHTFYDVNDKKQVTHHLPIVGVMNKRCTIYLCAGSIINPDILWDEIKRFDLDPDQIVIHPRAAVIERQDILAEKLGVMSSISSTQKGVGAALARKVRRESRLAGGDPRLKDLVGNFDVQEHLDWNCSALIEVPQGMDLSINTGLSYPYCTSREISVSSALSDADVHPDYLGSVIVCIRAHPIRVGGTSGPFYEDSKEMTWVEVGVDVEYTTNTKKVRRVCSFSMQQYQKMINKFRPDYVLLNFANYLEQDELDDLLGRLPEVTHLGFGPKMENIRSL